MNAKILTLLAALVSAAVLLAQEPQPIPPEDLAKATALLMAENARLGALPLKLELAPDQAMGFKVGDSDVGAIIIPDKRLKPAKGDRAGRKSKGTASPVGQLWTSQLSLVDKDAVLPNDKLRLTKVTADGKELELAVFALGIEKAGKKGFQLAVFAKDGAPVLRVPLTADRVKKAAALVMAARRTGEETGVLELKILGRYKAELPVGKRAE